MDKPSTKIFGQRGEKLAHLLRNCAGDSISRKIDDTEQQKSALLGDLLEDVLPADPAVIDSLPFILKHLYRELLPLAGESLGKLLLSPQTDISTIQTIKDYGKKIAESAESEVEKETSGTIYYAAIAGAIVFHDKKITQHTYEQLDQSYSSLIKKKWITAEISELFIKTRDLCRQKAGKNEE